MKHSRGCIEANSAALLGLYLFFQRVSYAGRDIARPKIVCSGSNYETGGIVFWRVDVKLPKRYGAVFVLLNVKRCDVNLFYDFRGNVQIPDLL